MDNARAGVRRAAADPFCNSDRGDWGSTCPACGQRLPPLPGPLRSWHAERTIDADRSAQARAAMWQGIRRWHI
ncbi:MAG: hypothetical protein M0Z49_15505 [Chloroflexi bacterium]|nr:hypothetical protein [Chloroflexota bacterium]